MAMENAALEEYENFGTTVIGCGSTVLNNVRLMLLLVYDGCTVAFGLPLALGK